MKSSCGNNWKVLVTVVMAVGGSLTLGTGCTEEQTSAVLDGVQVAANELDQNDDVSFRDWLSSELDD